MKVVLDTNILVSSLLFGGNPSQIIELIQDGTLKLFISPFILEEFENKLKVKFGFSDSDAEEAQVQVLITGPIPPAGVELTPDPIVKQQNA